MTMISDNLIIFVPNIVRAKNNFVRTRLSCFVKKLIEANGYKTTNDSSENYDIIHFPSYLDYIDNDYVIKGKKRNKRFIINGLTSVEEFEKIENNTFRLKKEVIEVYNEAFTVIVFFETQKIALRHLGITSPIQVIKPIGEKFKEDTEIFKTSFASAYGLQNSQKYVINYGLYDSDAFDDYANLARIMPDLEFYYFGKKFDSFLISKRYEDTKRIPNLHFENLPPIELVDAMFYSSTLFLVTTYHKIDCLYLIDCMLNRIPIVIKKNVFFEEMIENHAIEVDNFDDFYNSVRNILQNNKIEEAYEYASKITYETEKGKLARIYEKYLKL